MNNKIKKPKHGFEIVEYESRLDKIHYQMSLNKLDAILITTPHNFRYYTGLDSYFWESPTRPWFLIIPYNEKPIAIVPSIGTSALKKTWVKNILSWSSPNPNDEGVTILSQAINSLSKKFGKIGAEMGNESTLRMPINDYFKLEKRVKDFTFVDGSKLLWDLRKIKTSEEINRLEFICKIASDAYCDLPKMISIGETERSICNKLKIELINRGADHTIYMACASGRNGYNQIIFDPTDKILKRDNILFIDTGSTYDGYFCDFDRNFCFGLINKTIDRAYQATWNAVTKGIEEAKPGKKCSDIFQSINKILEEGGSSGNGVGRMGHGFGLQLTEPPSIMNNDETILKPGMAITIEPVYEFNNGNMIVLEENIIITEDGNKIITKRADKEIPVIK